TAAFAPNPMWLAPITSMFSVRALVLRTEDFQLTTPSILDQIDVDGIGKSPLSASSSCAICSPLSHGPSPLTNSYTSLMLLALGLRENGLPSVITERTASGIASARSRAYTPPRLQPMTVTFLPVFAWIVARRSRSFARIRGQPPRVR